MAKGVINDLEIVDVNKRYCEWMSISDGAVNLSLSYLVKGAGVHNTCQEIGAGIISLLLQISEKQYGNEKKTEADDGIPKVNK